MQFAKIKNAFGNEFMIPMWKAKKMLLNGDINDYEKIEVEHSTNTDRPMTQKEFEQSLSSKGISSAEEENMKLKQEIEILKANNALKKEKEELELSVSSPKVEMESYMDLLKKEADILGIKYSPNIGENKLKEKIAEFNK